MIVRYADGLDEDVIARLRAAYYEAEHLPVQVRDGPWIVADQDGVVYGCELFTDVGSQRWQTDLYVASGRYGIIATHSIMRWLEADARRCGIAALCGVTTNPRNLNGAIRDGWINGGTFIFKPLDGGS